MYKFNTRNFSRTVAARISNSDGSKKVNIVAEMITKNMLVSPFGFSATYHFVLGVAPQYSRKPIFTEASIDGEKTVMNGSIDFPTSSCEHIPQINCSLTINVSRKVADVEIIRKKVAAIIKEVRSLKVSHRYKNKDFENFVITVGNRQFKVDKEVLLATGSEFKEIIDTANGFNSFKDDKMTPNAFEIMLKFIYGLDVDFDRLSENRTLLLGVLEGANKYGVDTLREVCIAFCLLKCANNLKDLRDGFSTGEVFRILEYRDYCREVVLL